MHNGPGIEAGRFALRPGPMMAAADFFTVAFRGTGGHGGSTPHLATDATIAQAHFVLALQNVVGRNIPAIEPAVVSIGSIQGGSPSAPNVMPSEVVLTGTARTFSDTAQATMEKRLTELAHAHAAAQGCTATVDYRRYTRVLVNDADHTAVAARAAASIVGEEAVNAMTPPITGGEDFADMLREKPGAFIFIGNGLRADGTHHAVHTPHYNFNDDILTLGTGFWVNLVRQELASAA